MTIEPITFYPALGSPYSYVAAQLIDEIGVRHGRTVLWRPVRLGTVLSRQGDGTRPSIPDEKLAYWRHDVERICVLRGLPFVRPEGAAPPFDCDELYAACYALADGNEAQLRAITLAVLSVIWAEAKALKTLDAVVSGLRRFNLSSAVVKRYATSDEGQALHDLAITSALAVGMIGAPWMSVGTESFWGHDRLSYLDQWLGADVVPLK
jgi:2-hydroxychromene-2-carboxylate isomerase